MTLVGGYIGAAAYANTVEVDRRIVAALSSGRVGAISGFTIAPGAGMQMAVAAGSALVPGKSSPLVQGTYFAGNDASQNVAWPAAHATLGRRDALVLAVGDDQYGAHGASVPANGPSWIVVQGTAAASPVAPLDSAIQTAVGAGGWIRWADVLIPAAASSISAGNITKYSPLAQLFYCEIRKSAAQSIANSAQTTADFDTIDLTNRTESIDLTGNKVTIHRAGRYRTIVSAQWVANTTGRREVYAGHNGATPRWTADTPAGGGSFTLQVIDDDDYAVGDYIDMSVWQNSGGALNMTPTLVVQEIEL